MSFTVEMIDGRQIEVSGCHNSVEAKMEAMGVVREEGGSPLVRRVEPLAS